MIRLVLVAAFVLVACGLGTPEAPPTPQTAATPTTCGHLPKVYHPDRLKPVAGCVTFRGTVLANLSELDGDHHLWIAPDAAYADLLNAANVYHGQRAIVAEIVPACATQPADEDAAAKCPSSTLHEPKARDRVVLTGPLVEDVKHGGWREIHPVATLFIIG